MTECGSNSSHVRQNSMSNNLSSLSSVSNIFTDSGKLSRAPHKELKVQRSVSTFNCFMNSSKIQKEIRAINNEYFNNTKYFSHKNLPPRINTTLNRPTGKHDIGYVSPTAYSSSNKRRHYYLSDIMRAKFNVKSFNKLKDRSYVPLSKKEIIKKKEEEHFRNFADGFRVDYFKK